MVVTHQSNDFRKKTTISRKNNNKIQKKIRFVFKIQSKYNIIELKNYF